MKKMNTTKLILTLLTSICLFCSTSCNENKSRSNDIEDYFSEDDGYEDGKYCADVTYDNPNTGTKKTYTLEVQIENNEVITIYWSNGGWLDEDHFVSEKLDDNGYCSFTSDKGYEYEVQITGKNCRYTDRSNFQNDVEEDEKSITCPRCGDEKGQYDDYCYSCKRKIEDEEENTCSRCGGFEYGVYGGLCSSCKENDAEENE
jgi:hypothetical protein